MQNSVHERNGCLIFLGFSTKVFERSRRFRKTKENYRGAEGKSQSISCSNGLTSIQKNLEIFIYNILIVV